MDFDHTNRWLENPKPLDRAGFLKQGLFALGNALLNEGEKLLQPALKREYIRPPGAQPEALFVALCTRCDACTAACPHEAVSVLYGYGDPLDGTPVMNNLREHPCKLCTDTPCITACPTEALMPLAHVADTKVGTAVIDRLTCSAFRGSGCTTCYTVCPLKDAAIELTEGLPFVVEDACTGCGICQHHCPEDEAAITVYP